MYRKDYQTVLKIVSIAVFSALGFLLMSFAQIPYPFAPWLKIEFSEITTLISYSLYSFPGGIIVGLIKTLLDLSVHGITAGLGIGNITAFLTSILYCLSLFVINKIFVSFNKKTHIRIIGYTVIILFISFVLVLLNALFITPSYLNGKYVTCFNSGVRQGVIDGLNKMLNSNFDSYFLIIFVVYFPFNIIKGVLVFVMYELLYKRLFSILVTRSKKLQKIFGNNNELPSENKENEIEKEENNSEDISN